MNRRTAIKLGVSASAAGAAALFGAYRFLPPSPSSNLESVDVLARRLYDSLDDEQRAETCVAYDHPLRQYHNRGVWGGEARYEVDDMVTHQGSLWFCRQSGAGVRPGDGLVWQLGIKGR